MQGTESAKASKELKRKADESEDLRANDKGGVIILNLDNAETRQLVESCYRTTKTLINPLIDWEDEYLWWYIRHEKIELNPLYEEGFCRVGCIGCPMAAKKRWKEFERYPKYKEAYIRFDHSGRYPDRLQQEISKTLKTELKQWRKYLKPY